MEIALDRPRPDVLRAHGIDVPHPPCGFEARLPLLAVDDAVEVAVRVSDEVLPWYASRSAPEPEFAVVVAYGRALCTDDWSAIEVDKLDAQPSDITASCARALSESQTVVEGSERLPASIGEAPSRLLSGICAHFARADIFREMIHQAMHSGQLEYTPDEDPVHLQREFHIR